MVIVVERVDSVEKKGEELIELVPEALEPVIRKSKKVVVRLYKYAPLPFIGSSGSNYVERVLHSVDVSELKRVLKELVKDFKEKVGELEDAYLYLEMHYNTGAPIFAILCLSKLCPEVEGKKALLYLDTFSWREGDRIVSDLEASLKMHNISVDEVKRAFCRFGEKVKQLCETQ